jgi:hypothetical protein
MATTTRRVSGENGGGGSSEKEREREKREGLNKRKED